VHNKDINKKGVYLLEEKYNKEAIQRLNQRFSEEFRPEQILVNENMSAHTTFRTGGMADLFVEIQNEEQLGKALKLLHAEGLSVLNRDFYLLGNGSNLLVSDSGIRGVVLHLSKEYSHIRVEGNTLVCEAGATLAAIAKKACASALSGFEFAAGIPGSLGGAIVMNAGAYGGEMREVVKYVKLMTPEGKIIQKNTDEMHFGYRHSLLKEQPLIVLEAAIALVPGEIANIQSRMEELAAKRREKQPLEYPSAGSTFKRPEGYFAAKLIEDAGLRGAFVGGAQVSEKHCGFVVNKNQASSSDVYALIQEIQKKVRESSGVNIEPEVIFIGSFG